MTVSAICRIREIGHSYLSLPTVQMESRSDPPMRFPAAQTSGATRDREVGGAERNSPAIG
jgi:hypothetical protein